MNPLTREDIKFPTHHRCKSDGCKDCISLATITCRKVLGAVQLLKDEQEWLLDIIRMSVLNLHEKGSLDDISKDTLIEMIEIIIKAPDEVFSFQKK